MTRDVNRDTAMVKNMRMYNITVFLAMRLLSDEVDAIMFSALYHRAHFISNNLYTNSFTAKSHSKRYSFALQSLVFYRLKGCLLQCYLVAFVINLIFRWLQTSMKYSSKLNYSDKSYSSLP